MNSIDLSIEAYDRIIERIKKHTTKKVDSPGAFSLPALSGIYICCDVMISDVDVVYIGSSANMKKRINSAEHPIHKYHKKACNFLFIHTDKYLDLEKALIKEFKPKYNLIHTR